MYDIGTRPEIDKIFLKLKKRNPKQFKIIYKKLGKLVKDPHRYKNLRAPLNNLKRVHINKHFVLLFSIDEKSKTIILEHFDHHDKVYK